MCRPCLYTAHVYRDDVTLNLGRYYIYDHILLSPKWISCYSFCCLSGKSILLLVLQTNAKNCATFIGAVLGENKYFEFHILLNVQIVLYMLIYDDIF
jgi:hypothetical protein